MRSSYTGGSASGKCKRVPPSADGVFRYFSLRKSNQNCPLKSAGSSDYAPDESVTIGAPRLRSADAAEACLSASVIFGKSVAFAIPWLVFSDRNRVAKLHLCVEKTTRTDQLEGEAAHGKRESQRKVEIAKISLAEIEP